FAVFEEEASALDGLNAHYGLVLSCKRKEYGRNGINGTDGKVNAEPNFSSATFVLALGSRPLVSTPSSVRTTNRRGRTCRPRLERDLQAELYLARRTC